MKKHLIYVTELLALFWKFKCHYFNYFFTKKRKLYRILRSKNCRKIKAIQLLKWKVSYGSMYYKAFLDGKPVFIKVTSFLTADGYNNEIVLNKYIFNNSTFLARRTPEILSHFVNDDFYIIISEFFDIQVVDFNYDKAPIFKEFICEYLDKCIIHQDLNQDNLCFCGGEFCVIDYGYSICPNSDVVRLQINNNRIDCITDYARSILNDADFYYDDVLGTGINNFDRNLVNFIVGRDNLYYVKLGNVIHEYTKVQLGNRPVFLLHKNNS